MRVGAGAVLGPASQATRDDSRGQRAEQESSGLASSKAPHVVEELPWLATVQLR